MDLKSINRVAKDALCLILLRADMGEERSSEFEDAIHESDREIVNRVVGVIFVCFKIRHVAL
jgi:hypothetical protein